MPKMRKFQGLKFINIIYCIGIGGSTVLKLNY